jgi:hypothetical protein
MKNVLSMWTVYDNASDYPGKFVARRFDVDASSGPKPTASIIVMDDLVSLRDVLQFEMHLVCVARDPSDEPQIVETWL